MRAPCPPRGCQSKGSWLRLLLRPLWLVAAADAEPRGITHDAFLSHHSEAQDTAARVNDWLGESGYRAFLDHNSLDAASPSAVASHEAAVRAAATFVCLLSPSFFESAECCFELSVACAAGVPILFIVVDGSTWEGKSFPAAADVPEEQTLGGRCIRVRDAAVPAFASSKTLDHSRSYFEAFLEQLKQGLGPPPHQSNSPALGKTEAAETVRRLSREAMEQASTLGADEPQEEEEKLVHVSVESGEAGTESTDGGIALVGPQTTLAQVRAQIMEAHEEEEAGEEEEAHSKLLGAGHFEFLRPRADGEARGAAVEREQEASSQARDMGDPIVVLAKP